jgi:hypothetical protein
VLCPADADAADEAVASDRPADQLCCAVLCPADADAGDDAAEVKEKKKKKSKKDMSSLFDALGGEEGAANGVEAAAEVGVYLSRFRAVVGNDWFDQASVGTALVHATTGCAYQHGAEH